MARAPDQRIKQAKELYLQGKKLVEIASQLNLPEGTVRRWKCTHKWDNERSVKNSERSKRKKGGQPGNHNATGPPGNKNAEKFGFFSKYLPEETVSIIQEMPTDPLDIIWDQIQLSYAAIIRAQQLMYVRDQKDCTERTVMSSCSDTGSSEATSYQEAWDKQASFLKAQSRAMTDLRGSIKQYDEMLHKRWDLATEEQKARIEALKAKVKDSGQASAEDKVAKLFEAIGGALDAGAE